MVGHCTFHKGRKPGYIMILFYEYHAKHVNLCMWLLRTSLLESPTTFL